MPKRVCLVLILVVAFLGHSLHAEAQATKKTPKVSFGLLSGLSVSTISSDDDSMQSSWPADGLANYTGGGFLLVNLGNRISLRPEILYSGKGATGGFLDENGTWTIVTDRIHYLTVPVLVRIAFNPVMGAKLTPYAVAGPELAVKLKASQTADVGGLGMGVTTRSLSPFVKSTDVGVAFGGGVQYKRFIVEARYTLGLANVSADPSLPDAKNRAFAFIFGILF